jgi:hypothetical protein
MKILYPILSDIVVLIHFLWILFLISGIFLGLRYKAARIVHISGLIFALIIQIFDWYCPLTDIEVWLRSKYPSTLSYTGSFIVHYVKKLVYLDISRSLILVLSIFLLVFYGLLYWKMKPK